MLTRVFGKQRVLHIIHINYLQIQRDCIGFLHASAHFIAFINRLGPRARSLTGFNTAAFFILGAGLLFSPFLLYAVVPVVLAETIAGAGALTGISMAVWIGNGGGPSRFTNVMRNPEKISRPLQDKDGWNWKVNPKSIKKKYFKLYIEYLTMGQKNSRWRTSYSPENHPAP